MGPRVQAAYLVRVSDGPGPADRENAPALAHRIVDMIHLEGDLRADGRGGSRVRRGAEDEGVVDHVVVDREHGRAIRGGHRNAPHSVRGQQGAALLLAEFPQAGVQEGVSLPWWQILVTAPQFDEPGAEGVGQSQQRRRTGIRRMFLQVGEALRRHVGAASRFLPAETLSPTCGRHAPPHVPGFCRSAAGTARVLGSVVPPELQPRCEGAGRMCPARRPRA